MQLRPTRWSVDRDELDAEDQDRPPWDRTLCLVSVPEARREHDESNAAHLHASHPLVEPSHDLPDTQCERKLTGVERTPVGEESGVRPDRGRPTTPAGVVRNAGQLNTILTNES